jgi:hypothetical protein
MGAILSGRAEGGKRENSASSRLRDVGPTVSWFSVGEFKQLLIFAGFRGQVK